MTVSGNWKARFFKMASKIQASREKKKLEKQERIKTTKPKAIKNERKDSFSLDEVLALGGEKADYEHLLNVDDDVEEIEVKENELSSVNDIQDIENELKSFMNKLGFDSSEETAEKTVTDNKFQDTNKRKKKKSIQEDTSKVEDTSIHFDITDITDHFQIEAHTKILLKKCTPWYEKTSRISKKHSNLPKVKLDSIHNVVIQYWEKDVELYQTEKAKDKSSDAQWLSTVLKSGTLSDRTAALTMLTQESPVHCLRSIEALMNLAKKKARREALIAIDSLRHLWISDLLPDVKLRHFHQYNIENLKELTDDGSKEVQLKVLMLMVFEDRLKKHYAEFIDVLQALSKDSLVNIRTKVLGIIFELLSSKPEQEQVLLSMLANKLGDPDKNVSSKACYFLLQLVIKHPNMKEIVITEVERMLFRPNIAQKAQYYAVCFLNQIPLSHAIKSIASKLVSIYFAFFKIIAKKQASTKQNVTDAQLTKILSALLTGVNRAYPFTEGQEDMYEEQLNTLFKLCHMRHSATSIQALMLIYQVMESKKTVSDRFYQALYEKLLDPNIKAPSKQTMLLNLLFKSVRDDPTLKRAKSFLKRLLQVSSQEESSFLCGVLFLLSEIIKKKPGIKSMMSQPEEDDDEEHFVDAPEDGTNEEMDDVTEETGSEVATKPAWTFRGANNSNNIKNRDESNTYKVQTRNPLYTGAEFSCAWELVPLVKHFHPSAGHFGSSLIKGEDIEYKGDPLQDFTLLRFLDRFMYRNPKQKEKEHGNSVMQRTEVSSRLKEQPVNSKDFLHKSEEKVREDEMFFYRYFKMKEKSGKNVSSNDDDDDHQRSKGDEALVDEFDFASEMKKTKTKPKKRKSDDDEANESSNEDESGDDDVAAASDSDFDYDDLEDDSEDEDYDGLPTKEHFTDKDYEEALLSQLNSDGESIDGDNDNSDYENDGRMGASDGGKNEGMFAAADEFAHLLEKSGTDYGDYATAVHPKQRAWEERNNERNNKWKASKSKKTATSRRNAAASGGKAVKRKQPFQKPKHSSKRKK